MLTKGPRGRLHNFQMERREAPGGHERSGNIVVTDLALWKKV
ncbi:MAG: hypothetical protein ABIR56_17365 [Polaromonas sp.]